MVGTGLVIGRFTLDWMVVALIAGLACAAWTLYRAQLDQTNRLDLLDLIMEQGRLSRSACILLGAFGTSSWLLVVLTLSGKMTEGYFGLYAGAWIAPTVTKMIVQPSAGQEGK